MKTFWLICLSILCLYTPLMAEDRGPWEVASVNRADTKYAHPDGPLQLAVRIYQQYISPVDGPRCPMYPTCSVYAIQALDKHGPLLGVFLTVDRLYREIDPNEHQQPVAKGGYIRFYDPLENNDFWLEEKNN